MLKDFEELGRNFSSKIFGVALARVSLVLMEPKYSYEVMKCINKELINVEDEEPYKD